MKTAFFVTFVTATIVTSGAVHAFWGTYECKMTKATMCTADGCDRFPGGTTKLSNSQFEYCVFASSGCVVFKTTATQTNGVTQFGTTDEKDGVVLGTITESGFMSVSIAGGGVGSVITASGKCQ